MSPYCTYCGKEVEESWNACPTCGNSLKEKEITQSQLRPRPRMTSPPQTIQARPSQRGFTSSGNNNYGIASLISAVFGLLFAAFFLAPVLGIAAVILGILGINRDENNALALIGIVVGILDIAIFLLFYLLFSQLFSWFNWFDNMWGGI